MPLLNDACHDLDAIARGLRAIGLRPNERFALAHLHRAMWPRQPVAIGMESRRVELAAVASALIEAGLARAYPTTDGREGWALRPRAQDARPQLYAAAQETSCRL